MFAVAVRARRRREDMFHSVLIFVLEVPLDEATVLPLLIQTEPQKFSSAANKTTSDVQQVILTVCASLLTESS